jgi:hypothetical protein
MSTEFNWSWVAVPSDTKSESDSIDQSGGSLYTYRAASRGALSAAELSSSIDSISTNINQQWTLWRVYTRPIIDSLPAGAKDQRWRPGTGLPPKIDALTYGVQGTTLFVFNDATADNAYGRYWHTDDERPKTLAEAFEDVYSDIADLETSIESATSTGYDDTDLWHAIGNRYQNASLTSASSSLDARTAVLETNDSQLSDDLYGASEGYLYGWGTPLTYSFTKNIEELLKLHGLAGWQSNPANVTHSDVDFDYIDLDVNATPPADPTGTISRLYMTTNNGTHDARPFIKTYQGNLLDLWLGDVTLEPTGFANQTDSTLSFTASTRTFQISDSGSGSFIYYFKGQPITVSSDPTVVISDTNGLHFIYFDSSGNLVTSMTAWDLSNSVPVAIVIWNTDLDGGTGEGIIGEERHGLTMDWATHEHLHYSLGTQYYSGLGINGYTLDSDTDADVQFGITNGIIQDEDIEIGITHNATPTDRFEQILSDPAEIPVFYRTGASGDWIWDTATTFAFKNTAAGRVNYNNWTGATWAQQEATDNYYVAYWIVASNSLVEPVISIQGQREDSSLSDALDNNSISSVDFGSLPFQETRVLYRVIIRTKNSFGGTRYAKISDITDFRTVGSASGGAYVPVYHGSLDGLGNDDHSQYALLAGRSGGQIFYGSNLASEDLTLDSTSNATKGVINVNSAFAFNTSLSAPAHAEGQVYWDSDDKTLALQTDVSGVVLQVGQEMFVRARNVSGVTINDGEVVYITGATGNRPTVAKAQANSETTAESLGVATADILHQDDGYITIFGYVRDIDLSSFSDGDPLYLDESTAGGLTDTPPTGTNYVIKVGTVLLANVSGILLVDPRVEKTNTTSLTHLKIHDCLEFISTIGADTHSGECSYGTTTPAVTWAQALHMHSDGTWILADADDSDLVPCEALAISTGAGSNKQVIKRGYINSSAWSWTPGGLIYLSTTAGGLTQTKPSTTGDNVQIVGYAETSTTMYFDPQLVVVEVG